MAHHHAGSGSVAAINGHPLHPMLVPVPIGLLVGAFIADVVYAVGREIFWADAAFWLLAGGITFGLVAGVAGLVDLLGVREARSHRTAWIHGIGNVFVLLVAAGNLALRIGDAGAAVLPYGLLLSAAIFAGLLVTAWLGGELTYRHRIGVIPSAPNQSDH